MPELFDGMWSFNWGVFWAVSAALTIWSALAAIVKILISVHLDN